MALDAGIVGTLIQEKGKITGSPFLNVLGLVPVIYVLTKSTLYRDTSCLCMDTCHGLGNKEKTFTKASRNIFECCKEMSDSPQDWFGRLNVPVVMGNSLRSSTGVVA